MPTKGEKAKFIGTEARIKIGDEFVPLGKVEDIKFIKPGEEIPLETTGIDMTGFVVGTRNCELTMDMTTLNPLKLKLMLMGIPVVNVIMCKNCCNRHTRKCPIKVCVNDDFYCGYGELKCQE